MPKAQITKISNRTLKAVIGDGGNGIFFGGGDGSSIFYWDLITNKVSGEAIGHKSLEEVLHFSAGRTPVYEEEIVQLEL